MKALILFLLLSFGAVVSATAVGQDDMFTVDNQVNQPLGTVTINYTSGSTSLNVPSQGIFQTSISSSVASVVIDGTTIPNGTPAILNLASGTVRVTWTSSLTITIVPGLG